MIISKILEVCIGGAHKTQIVYQANLNFKTINPYLKLLLSNGMINSEPDGDLVVYITTSRGLALLDNYKQIQEELSLGT